MIGGGGILLPLPMTNGLTTEQSQEACTAIYKLRQTDLTNIWMNLRLGPVRNSTKKEIQKSLLDKLYHPQSARVIYEMATATYKAPGDAMQKRGAAANHRHQPYGRNGAAATATAMGGTNNQQFQMHQGMGIGGIGQNMQYPQMPTGLRMAPNFSCVPLPFYDVSEVMMAAAELPPVNNKMSRQQTMDFNVSADQLAKVTYRPDAPLPRFEVQLRFYNTSELGQSGQALKDEFPLNCHVRVDEQVVQLPNVIPTNKPNAEPRRPSRPVNITPYLSRFRTNNKHVLTVEWLADKRSWAAAVYFVYRVDSNILFKRLDENRTNHRSIEATKQEIIKKLNGGEDDIAMDQLKITLRDPLSKMRMTTPVRCQDCTHLQCFDLMSYLMMNEKKPTWQCPVCSGNCPYNRLIVDDYFLDMLAKVDRNMTEVELKKDGAYDVIKEEADVCLSDSDDDDDIKPPPLTLAAALAPIASSSYSSASNGAVVVSENGGKKKKAQNDEEIITLSDSDDDEELNLGIRNSLKVNYADQTPGGGEASGVPKTPPPQQKKKGSGSEIEIITLDDTPPRPVLAAAPIRPVVATQQSEPSASTPPGMGSNPASISGSQSYPGYGGQNSQRSSHSSQPSPSVMPQQQMQMNFPHGFMNNGQPTSSQAQQNFQYQQYMQHQQQFPNGIIGRNNQMMGMPPQQPQQQPPPGMHPQYYQQQMPNGNTAAPAPPGRLPPLPAFNPTPAAAIRFVEKPPPGVTLRNPRRPAQ